MLLNQTSAAFTLAKTIVQQTNRNLFLTGKAGTGKTTFLKYIKANTLKQLAVVAPTGVAAINAGGVTIHSFFGLPFTPFISNASNDLIGVAGALDKNQLLARAKINNQKKEIFQQLELLIIDEISMVRADVFDAIDTLLRHYRNKYYQAFGGVQVVCIGDMMQLPPVVKREEWQVLRSIYKSVYFFDSMVFANATMLCVELDAIYRQSDTRFITILNNIRNSYVNEDDLESLQQHYHPNFSALKNKGYITLTSHNAKADEINTSQLLQLNNPLFTFTAKVEGEFDEKNYPNFYNLQLKLGAQIMFIKNDLERDKKYYNGKIATISFINDEGITVTTEEQVQIDVPVYTWENIKYTYNAKTQKIEEEVVGSFKQYPIKLAWAITIHKSQGLTFEKVAIDAFKSFASGQVYVALSRCTSLQGIKLLSPINAHSLVVDEHIKNFNKFVFLQQNQVAIQEDIKTFLIDNLLQVFGFTTLLQLLKPMISFKNNHHKLLTQETNDALTAMLDNLQNLHTVAQKFHSQIQQLLFNYSISDNNVQSRITKAAHYFLEQLQTIHQLNEVCVVNPKTKIIKDEFIPKYDKFVNELAFKVFLFNNCINGFVMEEFNKAKFSYKPSLQSTLNILDDEIVTTQEPKLKKDKKQKGTTAAASLALFKEYLSIEKVAKERNLAITTIEGHLAKFIETGELAISQLMATEKLVIILKAIAEQEQNETPFTLSMIKEKLNNEFSFGEIKMVVSYNKFLKDKQENK